MPNTILSVDHDAVLSAARSEILRQAGFEVIEAAAGADTLELASEKQPALIVLAIELPGMDGFAVAKRLKSDPRARSIPVLHISNRGEHGSGYPESLKSGAEAYLQSPVDPATLVAVVTALILRRKQAEEDLQASEGRYRTLFETMTEGFALHEIICDEVGTPCDLRFLAVNPAFERQTGLKAGDILGRTALELFSLAEPVWYERYGNTALTGVPARFEEWFGPLERWFEVLAFRPEPRRLCAIFTDITGRKRAEEEQQRLAGELAERAGELQAILDAAPVAIWIAHDPECRHITGNTFTDHVLTQRPGGNISLSPPSHNEAVSFKVFRRGVELRPEELPAHIAAATGQPAKQEELDVVFPDGRAVHMLIGAVPLFDAAGRVRGAVAAGADITPRKRLAEQLRERIEELEALMEVAPVAIWVGHDRDCREITGNRMAHRLYEAEAGQNVSANVTAVRRFFRRGRELRAEELPMQEAAARGMEIQNSELDVLLPSGKWLNILGSASPLRDASGQVRGCIGAFLDVTERKRAEDALRESEERFRTMADGCPTIIWVADARGSIRFVNRTYREYFGVTLDQVEGDKLQPLLHPDDAPEYLGTVLRALQGRTPFWAEGRVRRADGAWRWVSSYAEPRFSEAGEFLGHGGTTSDITEHRQAETALRESESRLRTLSDNLPEGAIFRYRLDADGKPHVDFISAGIERLTGVPAAEFMADAAAVERNIVPEDRGLLNAAILLSRERITQFDVEVRHRHRVTGETRWSLLRSTPSRLLDGSTVWDGIELDITGLKAAQEALRESESRERARAAELEAIMEAAPAAIFIAHDAECRSMTGNRMAYNLLQREAGKNLSKSAPDGERPMNFRAMRDGIEVPPPDLPLQKAAFSGKPVRNYPLDIVFEDGVSVNLQGDAVPLLDEEGRPRGGIAVLSDVTELKRAEKRLREAQKLESLGLLAGGVAHDFNNLLVGVIGNASLAQEMLPPDHPVADLLDGVLRTGEQAAHLTRQMLAYSGKGKFVVEPLDLSALIPEMSHLVRPSISKKIALDFDLDPDLPPIEADRGQVQQVFMNLALNAAEAIGSHEGTIAVKTGVQHVDDRYVRLHPEAKELRPGEYVYLDVRDNGCGMDDATRAKIFDPFFSTKFTGRGLGLAAVAGILRGHHGAIVVSSALGRGSCFTVLFPASVSEAQERPANAALQGAGVVLVVDDEKLVREMAKKALERYGYTVLLADSGLAGIDVLKRHPGDIALVVLDLSMPHMSGEEALPELRKIRPEVKVVVSSGYSESETMPLFKGQRVSGFIQKPYTSAGLAERVKLCIG